MSSDILNQLFHEKFEYNMSNVHTAFPGSVETYDAATRRADIKPFLKRKLPNGEFMDFPVIPDVPVLFFGTKKYTIHVPLEAGDEVLVIICERSTDQWRDAGGTGIEDTDPRRFNLMDAFALPGLQAVDFIPVKEAGLNIIHKSKPDGDLISHVKMDDEKVEVKYKESIVEIKENIISATNGKTTIKLNGEKASVKNGSKSLFTIWDTLLTTLKSTSPTTLGSPAAHNWNPAIAQAIGTAQTDLGNLLEA